MVLSIILLLMAVLLGICSASYSYDLHALRLFKFRYNPGIELLCRIIFGVALILICFDGETAFPADWFSTVNVFLVRLLCLGAFALVYFVSFALKIVWDLQFD